MSKGTQFEYAWCLVRSKYNDDIRKGIALLEGEAPPRLPLPLLCPAPSRLCGQLSPSPPTTKGSVEPGYCTV